MKKLNSNNLQLLNILKLNVLPLQLIVPHHSSFSRDSVNEAESHIVHNKFGYPHPIVQTEPLTMNQFKAVATEELEKELQYQEILQQGRWEKLYNDAMDHLIKDYGYSLDFLREESFKIAYETARRKFDHCSSTLKKRIPSFMGVDSASMAAETKADLEEKNTSPNYREYVKDLLVK